MRDDRFRPRPPARWKRLLWLSPLALILAGVLYVNVGELVDRMKYPQVGMSYDIGGRKLNLNCTGTGSPAVIFESGYGWPGYNWITVQPRVAKLTRACWYDRAGYGWSNLASGAKHFSDSVAVDLHRLLAAAHVSPPYVLVGHSIGGFHVREFNALYPTEVSGLVLLDPSNEDIAAKIPNMPRGGGPNAPPVVVHIVDAIVRQTGLWRWFMRDPGPRPDSISLRDWELMNSLRRRREMIIAESRETPERGSADIVRRAGSLDSVPLILMTRGRPFGDTPEGKNLLAQWISLSGELAHRSTRGKQIVVEGSGHFIHFSQPGMVVSAIREVIDSASHRSRVAAPGADVGARH